MNVTQRQCAPEREMKTRHDETARFLHYRQQRNGYRRQKDSIMAYERSTKHEEIPRATSEMFKQKVATRTDRRLGTAVLQDEIGK